jgi:hypothetical protein
MNHRYGKLVEGRELGEVCGRLKLELGLEGGVRGLRGDLRRIEKERVLLDDLVCAIQDEEKYESEQLWSLTEKLEAVKTSNSELKAQIRSLQESQKFASAKPRLDPRAETKRIMRRLEDCKRKEKEL